VLLSLWFGAAVEVLGGGDCPAPSDVAAELARLAPPSAATPSSTPPDGGDEPRLSAKLAWTGDDLTIELRTADGTLLAERRLARSGSCPDLAAAAAVVIVAWQGERRADLGPDFPPPRAAPLPSTVVETGAISRSAPPLEPGRPVRPWEVGVAVLASSQDGPAPGIMIDGQLGTGRSGLAGRIGLLAAGAHTLSVGPVPGQSRWSRAALSLGLRDRIWSRSAALDGYVGLEGGLIRLEGAGFSTNYSRLGFDLGVGAGVRLAWSLGRVAPFLALGGSVWPGRKTVTVAGTTDEATLPRFELRASLGISFGRFR
jgi:hypothetical protein